jgi:hypothetical protein
MNSSFKEVKEWVITHSNKGPRQKYHSQHSDSLHGGAILLDFRGNLDVYKRILLRHVIIHLQVFSYETWFQMRRETIPQRVVSGFAAVHICTAGEDSDTNQKDTRLGILSAYPHPATVLHIECETW